MDRSCFDPAALDTTDPYAELAQVRRQGHVVETASGFWVVTGHSVAVDALRHPACTTSPIAELYLDGLPDGAARDEMGHRINFLDPPDHSRVRSLVNRAFTPRRVEAMLPAVRRTAGSLIDDIGPDATFDLLDAFAHHVPSLVISELLGVPAEDRDLLTGLSDRVSPLLSLQPSEDERRDAIDAAEEMHAYLARLMTVRRGAPGDDLISGLLEAEDGGERLSSAELLSLAATLYSAGHRTTRDLFTNGMSVLLAQPERYQQVVSGGWEVGPVVNEWLRYETPTLFVARVTSEPVVLGGVQIPASSPVLVFLAAANRDPDVYEDPDEFRPGRSGPQPLSFAFGAHYCLGASLARSEAEVMLSTIVETWPALAIDPDHGPLRWHQRGPFRGLDELVVRV